MECHEDFEHCLKGSLVFCSNLFFEADHFVVDNPVLFCGACNDFLGVARCYDPPRLEPIFFRWALKRLFLQQSMVEGWTISETKLNSSSRGPGIRCPRNFSN